MLNQIWMLHLDFCFPFLGTYYVPGILLAALHTSFHAVLQQWWRWYLLPLVQVRPGAQAKELAGGHYK